MRESPIQWPISKKWTKKLGWILGNCTHGCQREWTPLVLFIPWAWYTPVFQDIARAYPHKLGGFVVRRSLPRWLWESGRLQWERWALFWIVDTWHITEPSWWLAWYFVKLILMGCCSWALTLQHGIYDGNDPQICQAKNVAWKPGYWCIGELDTLNRLTSVSVIISNWQADWKSHSPLYRSPVSWTGMATRWWRILTESVTETDGRLSACCRSEETDAVYVKRHTQ